jgi:F-type H+-transporting ATPase subunit delta
VLKLQDRPVAARYARALFSAAAGQKAVDAVRGELASLCAALDAVPSLESALRHPRLARADKMGLLQKALGRLSPVTERFVSLLLEKKRWDALRDIVPEYERLADAAGGVLLVRVETPRALAPDERDRLRRDLEKKWGGTVSLDARVREDLVGGAVFRVGDRVWDNSLKAQLERLRDAWLPGSAR